MSDPVTYTAVLPVAEGPAAAVEGVLVQCAGSGMLTERVQVKRPSFCAASL